MEKGLKGKVVLMALHMDHFFVTVPSPEAASQAEAEALSAGLDLSHRRVHTNQGTENVCFKLGSSRGFAEILWARDPSELRSEAVRPTGLEYRCMPRSSADCPLGICFQTVEGVALPVNTWMYDVPFPPGSGMRVDMAENSARSEMPLIFFLGEMSEIETTGISVRRLRSPHSLDATTKSILSAAGVVTEEEGPWRMEIAVDGLDNGISFATVPIDLFPL